MGIILERPEGFSETGNRAHNEDSIYPARGRATERDRLFMVCDGVGGQQKGEVASALACTTLAGYFHTYPVQEPFSNYIVRALAVVREAFYQDEQREPAKKGMATTLTLLYVEDKGAWMAHLGDSRIYHIRNGRVLFRTSDHKWVNELVQSGVITEDQAAVHPKRNVISKVLSADRDDAPEIYHTADVQPGDFFFMCTDGVLEHVYDELLTYHLRSDGDNAASLTALRAAIQDECEGRTDDNYSGYLIRVGGPDKGVIMDERTKEFDTVWGKER